MIAVLSGMGVVAAQSKQVINTTEQMVELNASLPVNLTLVDAASHRAIAEIPSSAAEWVVFEFDNGELTVRAQRGYENKVAKLLENNPINLRIESSAMRCINNSGDMHLTYKNRRLARFEINNAGIVTWNDGRLEIGYLEINNSGVFRLRAQKVTADTIEINNAGRWLCSVCTFYCVHWEHNNSGVNDVKSTVEAKSVECNSAGCELMKLNVACEDLEINSTGIGQMEFSGTADNIEISSTGRTTISTSAVNASK